MPHLPTNKARPKLRPSHLGHGRATCRRSWALNTPARYTWVSRHTRWQPVPPTSRLPKCTLFGRFALGQLQSLLSTRPGFRFKQLLLVIRIISQFIIFVLRYGSPPMLTPVVLAIRMSLFLSAINFSPSSTAAIT